MALDPALLEQLLGGKKNQSVPPWVALAQNSTPVDPNAEYMSSLGQGENAADLMSSGLAPPPVVKAALKAPGAKMPVSSMAPATNGVLKQGAYDKIKGYIDPQNQPDFLKTQAQGIDELKSEVDAFKNGQQKKDISPLLGLTDSWTGSNFQKGYAKPLTDAEKQAKLIDLQKGLQGEQDKYSTDNLQLMTALMNKKAMDNMTNSAKSTRDQDHTMQSVQQMLESARGNPAAAQAERDIYAASKANSLVNLYGDPNQMSQQQVNLLVQELGKIASGGVPSVHELDGLSPGTLTGALSQAYGRLVNSPQPANAAAFIKQYQQYANALTNDAKKVITDKYGRIIESRAKQLGKDNYDSLKGHYLDRFLDSEGAAKASPAASAPSGGDLAAKRARMELLQKKLAGGN